MSEQPTSRKGGGKWLGANRSRAGTLGIMAVTAVLIMAAAYLTNKNTANGGGLTSVSLSGGAKGPAPKVGKPAPDFTAFTVDGKKVKLSQYRGHPVWLTFGASWCQPCRAENPDIQATYDKYKAGGTIVIGVFIQENASDVKKYVQRVGLTYPKIADENTRIASEYRILGIPSHFLIDKSGVLRILRIGSLDPEGMEKALAEIGAESGGPTQ